MILFKFLKSGQYYSNLKILLKARSNKPTIKTIFKHNFMLNPFKFGSKTKNKDKVI